MIVIGRFSFLSAPAASALLTALVACTIYFLPALSQAGWETGYALKNEGLHTFIAGFLISKFFFLQGSFTGVDFFTHGGASEFFLRPNYPVYYLPLLALTPLLDPKVPQTLTGLFVGLQFIHAIASTYFCHRICTRFLKFDDWLAAFTAVTFALSPIIARGLWFLPLVICAWLLPICIYAGLIYAERPRWPTLLLASLPAFLAYTAGYMPAGIATIAISSAVLLAWRWRCAPPEDWRAALSLWRCLAPAMLATAVILPYYLAAWEFHQLVEIKAWNYPSTLPAVVDDLSEPAQFLLRGLTVALTFPGVSYEFTPFWGLVPVLIAILYFAWLPAPQDLSAVARRRGVDMALLCGCAGIYLGCLLLIFGLDSALATVFYYFVPILGKMHIYQRFLVFAHFFFAVATALMLHFVVQDQRRGLVKLLLLALGVMAVVATQLAGKNIGTTGAIDSKVVVELLLAVIFLLAFLNLPRRGIVAAALVLTFLVALNAMYRYTNPKPEHHAAVRGRSMVLNPAAVARFTDWLQTHSDQPIIKYVDLTPNFHNYLSKNLPWFLLDYVKLSSYYGYEPHLGAAWALRRKMAYTRLGDNPEFIMRPDWDWLRLTGAKYVVFEEGHPGNDTKLMEYADLRDGAVYRFQGVNGSQSDQDVPARYVLAPLKFPPPPGDPVRFDNGLFRVQSVGDGTRVTDFTTDYANHISLTLDSAQPSQVQYLLWPGRHWQLWLDGQRFGHILQDGLMTVTVPPGQHRLELHYRNDLLMAFLAVYALYSAALLVAFGAFGFGSRGGLPLWGRSKTGAVTTQNG